MPYMGELPNSPISIAGEMSPTVSSVALVIAIGLGIVKAGWDWRAWRRNRRIRRHMEFVVTDEGHFDNGLCSECQWGIRAVRPDVMKRIPHSALIHVDDKAQAEHVGFFGSSSSRERARLAFADAHAKGRGVEFVTRLLDHVEPERIEVLEADGGHVAVVAYQTPH